MKFKCPVTAAIHPSIRQPTPHSQAGDFTATKKGLNMCGSMSDDRVRVRPYVYVCHSTSHWFSILAVSAATLTSTYTFPLCELEDRGEEGYCAAAAARTIVAREDRA